MSQFCAPCRRGANRETFGSSVVCLSCSSSLELLHVKSPLLSRNKAAISNLIYRIVNHSLRCFRLIRRSQTNSYYFFSILPCSLADDLMKDINSMLSDFSSELDSMFDWRDESRCILHAAVVYRKPLLPVTRYSFCLDVTISKLRIIWDCLRSSHKKRCSHQSRNIYWKRELAVFIPTC